MYQVNNTVTCVSNNANDTTISLTDDFSQQTKWMDFNTKCEIVDTQIKYYNKWQIMPEIKRDSRKSITYSMLKSTDLDPVYANLKQ